MILKPGEGTYQVNGRHLDEYFPRVRLQRMARQPLEAAGYQTRMDVVARIHGGGGRGPGDRPPPRHRSALVEADPALRGELKRRGYLTRDPRVKERKKAGLKKARKRPQFSKRSRRPWKGASRRAGRNVRHRRCARCGGQFLTAGLATAWPRGRPHLDR